MSGSADVDLTEGSHSGDPNPDSGDSQRRSVKAKKWCFVPGCKNTSSTTPSKVFLCVPKDLKKRRLWARLAKREDASSLSSRNAWYCCEDHFDLDEDTCNYRKYCMVGGHLYLKSNAVPHKFACQLGRMWQTQERPSASRRRRSSLLEDALATVGEDSDGDGAAVEAAEDQDSENLAEPATSSTDASCQTGEQVTSVACQTATSTSTAGCQTDLSMLSEGSGEQCDLNNLCDPTDKDYEPSSDEANVQDDFELKHFVRDRTRRLCEKDPKRYIGVPLGYLQAIRILARDHIEHGTDSELSSYDVCLLVLMKIKLNRSFDALAEDFGISRGYAGKLFAKFLPCIAKAMGELVYWPETDVIRQALPLAFKARFAQTTCIIDCMEIEVEKPGAAVNQSMTFSSYKPCNTVKYLVSITPNGFVNFVSDGYGGRNSDMAILEDSGFMDHLESGMVVMADRGFKSLEPLLAGKGCKLVRPSSVSSQSLMSKDEVRWTKQVASLRIHVERAIRRIREFDMLRPHACVEYQLWSLLDACVVTACGLVNLQPPLVRV